MIKFIIKRLLQIIPMLLLISFIIFFALELTGVDPLNYLLSPDAAGSYDNIEVLRESMGLNDPLIVRYFRWIFDMFKGDFGYSIVTGTAISDILKTRLPATMELAFLSLLFSTIIGVSIGIISAIKQNGFIDYLGRFLSVLGQSVPEFFFGMCIIQIFAIKLDLFPAFGRTSPDVVNIWGTIRHLVLPVATLTFSMCAVLMRYARSTMIGVINSDYIKTARSKGIPEWRVYIKHAFRNSMRPVLVILCFRLPMLIGGSVVIESVFSWPGLGNTIMSSVIAGDYPVILVCTLMIAAAILFASFLVDILTSLLDPRVRLIG